MNKIEEFSTLKQMKDKNHPFSDCYEYEDSIFYVEPTFITQLLNLKEMYSLTDYQNIINKMLEIAKRNKKVVFTYDYEHPYVKKDDFIYLELTDLTDLLKIYIEDKSRGSDYGD